MEDLVIEEEGASSALKITLGDFLIFINWMNQTEKSLERGEALHPAAGGAVSPERRKEARIGSERHRPRGAAGATSHTHAFKHCLAL